ncbi:MAG: signal peptidase [Ramlibacter sp.]|jgi:signal peptidase I|nr:signal peptidase [Ramlibacter sp.]
MSKFRNSSRPLFAAALSLVMPGLGQLANAEVNKAIWLYLGFAAGSVPLIGLVALYVPAGLMLPTLLLGTLLTLGIWVYAIADAWRGTERSDGPFARPWQTSGMYALVFVAGNLVALPLLIGYVRAHQVEPFRIPSTSMTPAVMQGDFLFADKRYNCPGCGGSVRRGDIAIFAYPNDRNLLYIKRIIALPGDHVQISGREVRVNGKPLSAAQAGPAAQAAPMTQSVTESIEGRTWQAVWGAVPPPAIDLTVPPGQVFVLGDNRQASVDSRAFGTVPLQEVVGRARQVWFSWGPDGVRWGRLGHVLE